MSQKSNNNISVNRERIRETIDTFLMFDAQMVQGTRLETNLRKNLRVVKKRALSVWVFLTADATLYPFLPLIRPGRHFSMQILVIYGKETIKKYIFF